MCWTGRIEESMGKIATKDITVYKVLYRIYDENKEPHVITLSPYRGMEYSLGETYEAPSIEDKIYQSSYYCRIDYGLHCYSGDCYACKTTFDTLFIDASNNDFIASYYSSVCTNSILVKCKIPMGTKYFENNRGEIVTEKLETISEVHLGLGRKQLKELK